MAESRADTKRLKALFSEGQVVCLTGAGISEESGIPTFRGEGGLWERYDPEIFAYAQGLTSLLAKRPQVLADFLIDFYSLLTRAEPNPAHRILAALERNSVVSAVITQNIDSLHQRALSRRVIELHGNAYRLRCMRCGRKVTFEVDRVREMVATLKKTRLDRRQLLKILSRYFPVCACAGRFRIDVVFFQEPLPQDSFQEAVDLVTHCRTLLIVGTSLAVYPAAHLPHYAKQQGARLIEINQEETSFSSLCDLTFQGSAGGVLESLAHELGYT